MFGEFVEKVVAEGLTDAFEKIDVDVLPLKDAIAVGSRAIYLFRKPFDGKALAVKFRPDELSEVKIRFCCVSICHFWRVFAELSAKS